MRTIHFKSEAFLDPDATVAEHMNQLHGKSLSDFLKSILSPDYETDEPFEEDFGWGLNATGPEHEYFLGQCVAAEGDGPTECFVTVEKKSGFLAGLMGKNKVAENDPIIERLCASLSARSDISDIRTFGR